MCISSTAVENVVRGEEQYDSVILRVMTEGIDCTCDLLIENQIQDTQIFMQKYQNKPSAAPEKNLCGLAIDIKNLDSGLTLNPIDCSNGVNRRSMSMVYNGAFRFTSRITEGHFSRGYCIHIIRGVY